MRAARGIGTRRRRENRALWRRNNSVKPAGRGRLRLRGIGLHWKQRRRTLPPTHLAQEAR